MRSLFLSICLLGCGAPVAKPSFGCDSTIIQPVISDIPRFTMRDSVSYFDSLTGTSCSVGLAVNEDSGLCTMLCVPMARLVKVCDSVGTNLYLGPISTATLAVKYGVLTINNTQCFSLIIGPLTGIQIPNPVDCITNKPVMITGGYTGYTGPVNCSYPTGLP